MGIGTSVLLIVLGLIVWAIGLPTIGWILIVVGAVMAVLSMVFWSSWGGYRRTRVVDRY